MAQSSCLLLWSGGGGEGLSEIRGEALTPDMDGCGSLSCPDVHVCIFHWGLVQLGAVFCIHLLFLVYQTGRLFNFFEQIRVSPNGPCSRLAVSPSYVWETRGTGRLSKLFKIRKLKRGKVHTCTGCQHQRLCSHSPSLSGLPPEGGNDHTYSLYNSASRFKDLKAEKETKKKKSGSW